MTVSGRDRIYIDTEQTTYKVDVPPALVGFQAGDDVFNIEGWKWDERFWTTFEQENNQAIIPTLYDASMLGLTSDFFQSGIGMGNDLFVNRIIERRINDKDVWTTEVNHGEYFIGKRRRYLFSDDSIIQYINPIDNENGHNVVQLDYKLKSTIPIRIETYKRDIITNNHRVLDVISPKLQFSGNIIDGEELTTFVDGKIVWANVDTNKSQAIIIYDKEPQKIIFNKNYISQIGKVLDLGTPDAITDSYRKRSILEKMGETNEGVPNAIFRTEFFPILRDDTMHVYIVNETPGPIDPSLRIVEWTRVDNFNNSTPTDTHFIVDRDLGYISFGDGINGAIPPTFHVIFCTYRTTYKIEYEAEGTKDILIARDINLNPVIRSTTTGFLSGTETSINIGYITLSTNEQLIPGTLDIRGPVTLGNDFGIIMATVYDTVGEPISDVEVTLSLVDNPTIGTINGISDVATITTNSKGQAIAFYNPPHGIDRFGYYSATLENSNQTLVINDTSAKIIDPADVYIFQVRKDDPMLGKVNANTNIGEVPFRVQANPFSMNGRKLILYNSTVNDDYIHPRTGEVGAIAPMQPVSIAEGRKLIFSEALAVPDPNPLSNTNPLAGYWIISTRVVNIIASVYSSFLGRSIESSTLKLQLSLPEHLLGVYILPSGNKIPFGFRIRDNVLTASSAFGGATFLSINPPSAPNNVLVTQTGDYDLTTSWNNTWDYPSSPITGFTIERSTNGRDYEILGTAAADETSYVDAYVDNTINTGNTYQYRVRADIQGASSEWVETLDIMLSYTKGYPGNPTAPYQPGVVLHYILNEASGVIYDKVSNTTLGLAQFHSPIYSQALTAGYRLIGPGIRFDAGGGGAFAIPGVTGPYNMVYHPVPSIESGTQDFVLELWLKCRATSSGSSGAAAYGEIGYHPHSYAGFGGIRLHINYNNIYFQMITNDYQISPPWGKARALTWNTTVGYDQLRKLRIIVFRSLPGYEELGYAELFMDGISQGQKPIYLPAGGGSMMSASGYINNTELSVGCSVYNGFENVSYFKGTIYEVRKTVGNITNNSGGPGGG